ncbi:MAG: murein biosynthesis integral membrane protein MurJ [Thermodesulfovibrio sp.]|nr:murein biosynthesis integral membrane protein MurJ [Thermodesulfovibrio sp.]MCX7723964.1 murein biosynthesis integral membrane protein MurJ [Thermodesulfovibrio sp.]MDW7972137.1 murein biosynthesis integral membrane protein MurJ [Thermodesulfovibrio sp.]
MAKGKIVKAAGAISLATIFSRILGYIKDMILAKYFGATALSDVFFVAFRIPNLLRELFAEGSMSSAVIPVLKESQIKQGQEETKRIVKSLFTFILIVVGTITILGMIFAPIIVKLIAPGFIENNEKFELTVLLTRIMFPFLLFISLAALTMGTLNINNIFFIPALAPCFLNIAIIVVVVGFSSFFLNPIVSVAVGVTLGGLLQWLVQIPQFYKSGFHFGLATFHPALKKITLLIIPTTIAMAVNQINIFISTIIASFLPEGSITYLYYSMRLIQLPIGVFGVAVGMAVLPTLSQHFAQGNKKQLATDFIFSLKFLFFLTIPSTIGLIMLKEPIVNTLFQRGAFDSFATFNTAQALLFYSIGILGTVGSRTITATFYSLHDTKTPVICATVGMLTNILFSLLLMNKMKHNGLALAYSLAATVQFLMLSIFIKRKINEISFTNIIPSFFKSTTSALVSAGVAKLICDIKPSLWLHSEQMFLKFIWLLTAIGVAIFIYFLLCYLMKHDELSYILKKIRRHR